MRLNQKIRTGICISNSLLQECDAYIKAGNADNRSALIEDALRLFLASRELKDKQTLLVPELAECIAEASDEGFTKISKGLFRYAVEVEMIIMILSNLSDILEKVLKEYRKEAVRNVRRTKGKLNLEELIQRDNFGIAEKNLERPEPQETPLPDDSWMYEA